MTTPARAPTPLERLTASPALAAWWLLGRLPPRTASALGAWLGGLLGPLHPKHRKVKNNLRVVLAGADETAVRRVARASWRNAGATFGEFPHLAWIFANRTEVVLHPRVGELIAAREPLMVIGGHLGSWELQTFSVAERIGPATFVYTPERNVAIARAVQRFRAHPNSHYSNKQAAVPSLLKAASAGRSIGLMGDLRVDSGLPLEFFGVTTDTSTAPARIAIRSGLPLVPMRCERLEDFRFRVTFHDPIETDPSLDQREAAVAATEAFNRLLEAWIGERPDQWLCTKRRWPAGVRHAPC